MRIDRASLRRHYGSLALLFAGVLQVTIATTGVSPGFVRGLSTATGVALVAVAGYLIGVRETIARYEAVSAAIPARIGLHVDDEGKRHAFVETLGGDVTTIEIPDDVYEAGPEAAMRYVVERLAEAAE